MATQTSNSIHTPGPLRVVSRGLSTDWDVEGPNGEDLSGHLRGMFAKKADARLFAAAPDLLEAAKDALVALEDGEGLGFQSGDQAHAVLTYAIAKAEGR